MSATSRSLAGGCLCGRLRYEITGEALYAGYCFCADCRKASGSGFIPFIGVAAGAVRFEGEPLTFRSPSFRGGVSTRNACPACAGLVYGGEKDSDSFTIYAGSLDDPTGFKPTMAIFNRDRPAWTPLPEGLTTVFETMPPADTAS
jgi:hypothetical protein